MKAHTVVVRTAGWGQAVRHEPVLYWWRCSCGRRGPDTYSALSARRGGEQHRAKMEK